jgi:hypothetical protein
VTDQSGQSGPARQPGGESDHPATGTVAEPVSQHTPADSPSDGGPDGGPKGGPEGGSGAGPDLGQGAPHGWNRPPGSPAEGPSPLGGEPSSGRNALWLAIAGLALTLLGSLWAALAGLALCGAAIVIGFQTRRRARRDRVAATGADVGIAVGAVGLVFALLIAGMSALLYQEMSTYSRCIQVSNTHTDRETCRDQFLRGIEDRLGAPRGQLQRTPLFG